MVLEIRDYNFQLIDIIDVYESLIWTERYNRYGDFELVLIPSDFNLNLIQMDRVITRNDTKYVMFIEQVELKTNPQTGHTLIVSGRSMEVLFTRRVIWPVFNQTLQLSDYITKLIRWCFPLNDNQRRVNMNIVIESSTEMNTVKTTSISSQHTGDVLYEVISELCDLFSIGYRFSLLEVISGGDDTPKVYDWVPVVTFYAGKDRSYEQNVNPWIVFSDNFNNIGETDDLKSTKELGTIAYIAGEEQQPNRVSTTYVTEEVSNPILRREVFVDARDIQSTYRDENGDEQQISSADYINLLKARGEEKMQNYVRIHDYEANVDSNIEHIYGVDYFLGDIIEIVNSFGHEVRARVMEVVTSDESDGLKVYPTFEIIE